MLVIDGVRVTVGVYVLVGVNVMGVLVNVGVAVLDGVAEADGVTVAVAEVVGELPPRTLGAVTSMDTLRRIVRELVAIISFTAKGTILGTIGV